MTRPMPTASWQRWNYPRCKPGSISTAGGMRSRWPCARNSTASLPRAESRQIMQAKYRHKKREPGGIGAIEKETLERGKIETEQPDAQERHRQRSVVAAAVGSLKIPQGYDDQYGYQQCQSRQPHRQRGVEISVMAVRGVFRPLQALRNIANRVGAPERLEAVAGRQAQLQRLQCEFPDVGAARETRIQRQQFCDCGEALIHQRADAEER